MMISLQAPETHTDVIARIDAESIAALDIVADCKITTDAEYEDAAEILKSVKRMSNELEATRTAVTKPINEHLRQFNALFAPTTARLELIERRFKSMVAAFAASKVAEQQRLLREAAKAAMQQAPIPVGATLEQANELRLDAALAVQATLAQAAQHSAVAVPGISMTEKWEWSVNDLSHVPREYMCIDAAKVNAAVKAGIRKIPGISIFPTTQTRVTAGK